MAISSAVAVFDSVNSTTQTTASITYHASATGTSQGANTVGVGISSTSSGSFSAIGSSNPLYTFTTAWGTTSSQKSTGTLTATISGLSASTTYTGYIVVYGLSSGNILASSASRTITTASPPPPPSQNWGPSLSGTAVSGTSLSVSAGSYNNASSVTTTIAYNTSGSFSGSSSSRSSPYTVTDTDASSPPYYFAALDTVVGTNGSTYYYYSGSIISKLKVSFNTQGGSAADVIPYIAGNSIQLPYTSRSGYSFNGWYTASSGGTYIGGSYSSYTPSTSSSITLYAQWTAIPPSQNYSPSMSGTPVEGNSLSAIAGSYNNATSVTTKIAYNVSTSGNFVSGTTTALNMQTSPYTVTSLDASSPPYYFAAVDEVLGSNGTTYYYYSTPTISQLRVVFDSNGGDSVGQIAYIANSSSPNSITLPYVSKSGYSFDGWYTASSGGTRVGGIYDQYQPPTSGSIGLYAHWSLIPITKNYSPSLYGSGIAGTTINAYSGGYSNGTIQGTSIAYNTNNSFIDGLTTPPGATHSSTYTITNVDATTPPYYFAAVDEVKDGAGTSYYYYSSSIESAFQITYVYNNGNSNSYTTFFSASPNPSQTLPEPTKTGHTFNGWFDSDTGGNKVYSPYTPPNSNITLYAQWSANDYVLTYNANGGSVSPSSKIVKYGNTYGSLPTPQRNGYTFLGWFDSLSDGNQVTSSTTYSVDYNNQIYAHWQANTHTISFYPNYPLGGTQDSVVSTKSLAYGSQYGELPTLTRTGFTLDGWFDAASGGSPITATDTFTYTNDINLYAHWTASTPVFSDQTITITAYLNKNINTLVDHTVVAAPVTSYSIIYSGSGLDPTSWISIVKESGTNNGILSGKPTQIGIYTFVIRAINEGGGYTDSGLVTLTVYPTGKRSIGYSTVNLTTAKRYTDSGWVDLKIMRRFDGTSWQDISNI